MLEECLQAAVAEIHARGKLVMSVAKKTVGKLSSVSKAVRYLKMSCATLCRKQAANWKKKQRKYVSIQDSQKAFNIYLWDASREMPSKKDTMLVKGPDGTKQPVETHRLQMSQCHAYAQFLQAHPEVKMSQRHFHQLRPRNVKRIDLKHKGSAAVSTVRMSG